MDPKQHITTAFSHVMWEAAKVGLGSLVFALAISFDIANVDKNRHIVKVTHETSTYTAIVICSFLIFASRAKQIFEKQLARSIQKVFR